MSVGIIATGVDSLYLSFCGEVAPALVETMDALKTRARDGAAPVRLAFEGGPLGVLQPNGWGRYRFWLRFADFDLFISAGHKLPAVYAQLKSVFLHSVGPEAACEGVEAVVRSGVMATGVQSEVSRIDLYTDFQGWVPVPADLDRFVTRAAGGTLHHQAADTHFRGRRLTGFTFGKDAVVARLYDKTAEISHTGKEWMWEVWGQRADRERPIWRLEFQFRRDALRDFNAFGRAEVLAIRQDLWNHGVRWLSLRQPRSNRQRDHWQVAPEWQQLSGALMGARFTGVVRKRWVERRREVLVQGATGYMTSLAAQDRIEDLGQAATVVAALIERYLRGRGRTFAGEVRRKAWDQSWRAPVVTGDGRL